MSKKSKVKVKIKAEFVFDDWRDRRDTTRSVYNTQTGVELSMSAFHHGTTFKGEIEVEEDEAKFLSGVMRDGWCPVFIVVDPDAKWRWK